MLEVEKIKQSIEDNKSVEGWLADTSEVVMHCLLSALPNIDKEKQDFLEIGCWKGKSANVLQMHNGESNLYLFDTFNQLQNFKFGKNTFFELKDINYLNNDTLFLIKHKFSVIHEDTLHNIRTTLSGLELASKVLTNNGLYIIDDFSFSDFTVISTVLSWLERHKEFSIFLVDGQKAYLTRTEALPIWYKYCVDQLQDDYIKITGKCTYLRNRQNIKENSALYITTANPGPENKIQGQYSAEFSTFGSIKC